MSAIRYRGQPLASLGLLLAGWIALRAAVWEPPFALPGMFEAPGPAERAQVLTTKSAAREAVSGAPEQASPSPAPIGEPDVPPAPVVRPALPASRPVLPLALGAHQPLVAPQPPALTPRVAAAHQLLYLAALGRLPLPPGLALVAAPRESALSPGKWAETAAPRWSGDGWLLVRRGSGGIPAAAGFPSYGASQAGGVIRFALAPGAERAPRAYLRVSRALGGFDEGEVAAGLSARPFARVPLRLLAEARVQRGSGQTRVRPAASLVSELPPVRLPLGIAGEAYAQAGYAGAPFGGKRGATPFFDVQAVADRRLASAGPAELRLGAGLWSGGQNDAARLDLGPRASVRLDLGAARSRLALDWRVRVAGNARPASGPTLTFSAGF